MRGLGGTLRPDGWRTMGLAMVIDDQGFRPLWQIMAMQDPETYTPEQITNNFVDAICGGYSVAEAWDRAHGNHLRRMRKS